MRQIRTELIKCFLKVDIVFPERVIRVENEMLRVQTEFYSAIALRSQFRVPVQRADSLGKRHTFLLRRILRNHAHQVFQTLHF